MAAIDRRNNPVDPHLALLADRHLGNLADDGVVAFVDGDAPAAARSKRLPQSLFSAIVSSTPRKSGRASQQRASELVWVLPRRCASSSM